MVVRLQEVVLVEAAVVVVAVVRMKVDDLM
jgi:hypothetical protein